ncbi:LysR substrate-binding domain-containing protein [Pandoraea sp. SD6-2]|uniref:LysR substrate-binding domain-containing protein n=1 Tax=Pandoraea sp. SD6-2 TaxID=1286093 RepID=UPI0009DBF534|nr:LysR substrate-binding domain-containing protein [Pandoraea sp. SD6-2]
MKENHTTLPPMLPLRAFEAVARLGGVTAAAAELYVTHTVISKHLKQLEEFLGVKLTTRDGRRIALTPSGQAYAMQVIAAFSSVRQATRALTRAESANDVIVTVSPAFATRWLLPRLEKLKAVFPEVRIHVDMSYAYRDLDAGEADVAVRHGNKHLEGLVSLEVCHDSMVPVAAKGSIGADMLANRDFRSLSGVTALQENWEHGWAEWCEHFKDNNADASTLNVRQFPDSSLVFEAVKAGLGIGLVRQSYLEHAQGVVTFPHLSIPARESTWIAMSRRSSRRATVRMISEWLQQEFRLSEATSAA